MTRDDIIARLVAAFGPHQVYDSASRSYVPDGNDAYGVPFVTLPPGESTVAMRIATYGEIADALAVSA